MERHVHKGRGATANAASPRFERETRHSDGDWRDSSPQIDGAPPTPATQVTPDRTRSIITKNTSPDIPFDRSINPYRGCEHGCIYCFARPSHAYLGLSPGLDFETRLTAKPDAARLLRAELARPSYRPAVMAMGTNTDPWQPVEGRMGISRAVLEVLAEHDHPVAIVTKSDRVLRDLDILGPMAARGLAQVGLSITTLDPALARLLEPRAPAPARRLAALTALRAAGVPTLVMHAPMIPAINDAELEALMAAAAEAGAQRAHYIPLRLPHEVAPLFREWLATHFPDRARHVMSLVQSIRDGRDNDPDYGSRMHGTGAYADLLRARFNVARRRFGLDTPLPPLRTDRFRPPAGAQLRLAL